MTKKRTVFNYILFSPLILIGCILIFLAGLFGSIGEAILNISELFFKGSDLIRRMIIKCRIKLEGEVKP